MHTLSAAISKAETMHFQSSPTPSPKPTKTETTMLSPSATSQPPPGIFRPPGMEEQLEDPECDEDRLSAVSNPSTERLDVDSIGVSGGSNFGGLESLSPVWRLLQYPGLYRSPSSGTTNSGYLPLFTPPSSTHPFHSLPFPFQYQHHQQGIDFSLKKI